MADDPDLKGSWAAASTMVDAEHPLTGTEVEREAQAWKYGQEFLWAHLDQLPGMKLHALGRIVWAYREAGNRTVDLAFRAGWIISLPFFVIGLFWLGRRSPVESLYLLTPLATVLVTAVVFYGCARFRDGAAPVLAVFVAAGVTAITERVFNRPVSPTLSEKTSGQ